MTDRVYDFLTAPQVTAAEIRKKRRIRAEKISGMFPGAIRYDVPRVQSSPSDRMSEAMAEVDELDRDIRILKDRLKDERRQIVRAADELEEQERRVVILRYIDRLQWGDIARVLHRSKSTVHRLHRSAGDKIEAHCLMGEQIVDNFVDNVNKMLT